MDNDKVYEAAEFLHVMVRSSLENLENRNILKVIWQT